MTLYIYITGYILYIVIDLYLVYKNRKQITVKNLVQSIFYGAFSWITLISGLLILYWNKPILKKKNKT